jgi:polar amino acid transport system substrate-binding protein
MTTVQIFRYATLTAALLIGGTATADQLADIKAKGTLVCGVMTNLDPFAFTDPKSQEQVGYDIDFCKGVAKELGVKPELKVISFDARIPELNQGGVDLLAAVLGYTEARAKQIDYSDAYFVSIQKMGVRAESGYKTLDDLAQKRVGAVKASSTLGMLQDKLPSAKVINYDDAPAAFMALVQGKVEGFGQSETLLRRWMSRAPDQKINVITPPMGQESWGLGLRKNEPAFQKAVNDALAKMEASGESAEIFDRWLGPNTIFQMAREFKTQPITQ